MAKIKPVSEIVGSYVGKVALVYQGKARVYLWGEGKKVIIEDLPLSYFSDNKIKAGDSFKYNCNVHIEMLPSRKLTPKELSALEKEVMAELPKDQF